MNIRTKVMAAVGAIAIVGGGAPQGEAALLIGNSKSDNILVFDELTGTVIGDFTTPGIGGLRAPDAMTFGPDGNVYVSVGGDSGGSVLDPLYPQDSAVLRFSPTGEFLGVAAAGNGLARPYGNAFGPDGKLYVSSFRTNQILRFDGATGAFIDVFASDNNQGFGTLDGLNGPNGLLFGPDGSLYVTTEGTVNNPDGTLAFKYASQILRYSPEQVAGLAPTTTPTVFVDQPALLPENPEFVSLLGLALAPDAHSLYVSDFAGGIRRYDLAGQLLEVLSTDYTGGRNYIGSLAFGAGPTRDNLYVTGFDRTTNLGSVLAFPQAQGNPTAFSGTLFTRDAFVRPIGITAVPAAAVPEPTTIAGVGLAIAAVGAKRRFQARRKG